MSDSFEVSPAQLDDGDAALLAKKRIGQDDVVFTVLRRGRVLGIAYAGRQAPERYATSALRSQQFSRRQHLSRNSTVQKRLYVATCLEEVCYR